MAIADLFRPKHKHSNSDVRAAAVAAMDHDNLDILIEVAERDGDAKIRRSAIAKIEDPELLAKVAESQDDAKVRDYAIGLALKTWLADAIGSDDDDVASAGFQHVAAHGGDKAMAEIAGAAKSAEVRSQALARLKDEKALVQVVRKVNRAEEWKAALERIVDPLLLRGIAIDEKRKEVATAALERIDNDSFLEEIVNKAKNKSVRTKAKRLRAELAKSKAPTSNASNAEKRERAERSQLAREVEDFVGGNEWIASRTTVDEAEARWAELGDGSDAELVKRFARALGRYNKNHAIYGAAAAEAARRAEAAERALVEDVPAAVTPASVEAAPLAAESTVDVATEVVSSVSTSAVSTSTVSTSTGSTGAVAAKSADAEDAKLDNQDELERLCEELEELQKTSEMKGFDRALKDADKARRKIGALPKAVEEALRERYDTVRRAAVIRLGELREADEWKRWAAVPKMEALVARAKALVGEVGAEVKNRGEALKKLQREWRDVGPSPRAKGEELWKVFKATCDEVYETVKVEREARSEEQNENLEKKEALCLRAEELQSSTDWQATSEVFKELQSAWKSIGPVPRRKSDGLWKRFRSACDAFFEARAPHLEEKFSEEADNLDAKTALVQEVQVLAAKECTTPETLEEHLSAVRELQSRWRDIGKVAHREFAALNDSYREACDKIYAKRSILEDVEREAQVAAIAAIEEKIGACADAGWDSDASEVAATVVGVLHAYGELNSSVPDYEELGERVNALIRTQLESEPAAYKGTVLDPERSAAAREKIIVKAEGLAPDEPEENVGQTAEEIAEKLRAALADRALGGVLSKLGGRSAGEVVTELRDEWSQLGLVPGAAGTALASRFEAVCSRILSGEGE